MDKLKVPKRYEGSSTKVSGPALDIFAEEFHNQDTIGIEKYGGPLEYGNGRDSLTDFMQEMADGVKYGMVMGMELKLLIAFIRMAMDEQCFPDGVVVGPLETIVTSQELCTDDESAKLMTEYYLEFGA